jgi:hypothetical protein
MSLNHVPPAKWRATALASALALLTSTMPMSAQTAPAAVVRSSTKTPIQHVIVIIGENRTFDHIFATYKPTIQGETIDNLLSTKNRQVLLAGDCVAARRPSAARLADGLRSVFFNAPVPSGWTLTVVESRLTASMRMRTTGPPPNFFSL